MRKWFAEATGVSFSDMMSSLADLKEALPVSNPNAPHPYPPCPRPCRLRPVGIVAARPKRRSKSLPSSPPCTKHMQGSMRRSKSAPPRHPAMHQPCVPKSGPHLTSTLRKSKELLSTSSMVPVSGHETKKSEQSSPPVAFLETVSIPADASVSQTPPKRPSSLKELPFSVPKLQKHIDLASPGQPPNDQKAMSTGASMSWSPVAIGASMNCSPVASVAERCSPISHSKLKVQLELPSSFGAPLVAVPSNRDGPEAKVNAETRKVNLPTAFSLSRIG